MIINKVNSYVKATFFYILGNGIGQGLMLLSTIVFTRIMSKTDYGLYSTYYSVVSLMTTLVGANLYHAVNNAYIDYKNEIHQFRASNLFLSTVVFLLISALCLITNIIFNNHFPFFLVIFSLLHSFSFFVITFYNNSANMENRYIAKSLMMVLPNLFQILFSIVFIMVLPLSALNSRVLGSTLGVAVCSVFAYISMIKREKHIINFEYWKYALKISVPSVFSSISYMIMSQSDNLMITAFRGPEETAVYSLIYYIGYIIYAVIQATDGVLKAWLYNVLDSKRYDKVRIIQKWYLFAYAVIVVLLLMLAPEIIKILSPPNYWNFHYVGPFIVGSYFMVVYSFFTNVGMFHKKTLSISFCVFASAVINIILNYIFIPIYGGVSAAIASAVSYGVLSIILYFVFRKQCKHLYKVRCFIIFVFLVIAMSILFELVLFSTLIRYIVFLVILLGFAIYALVFKKEWMQFIKK